MQVSTNSLYIPLRIIAIVLWMLFLMVIYCFARIFRQDHMALVHNFHRGVCRIIGVRFTLSGEQSEQKSVLYVSNHVSYLDIFVLGFIRAYFIAKSEVASWPIFGPLARFQNTLFFERKAGKSRSQLDVMKEHLQSGKSLTLFAEGTSTNGTEVKPFKSSLFEAANTKDAQNRVAIQPITIVYTHYDGHLIDDQETRDNYAWYATMPFTAHFMNILSITKKVDAKVHFHTVCYLDEFASRKECADYCQSVVAAKMASLLNDRELNDS